MSQPAIRVAVLQQAPDFSLVMGGPLFQLFRKAHLSGDHLQLLYRRIIVITAIAWLPLFLLSTLRAPGGGVVLPFARDIETHVRLLVALPVLILAELIVHLRLRSVILCLSCGVALLTTGCLHPKVGSQSLPRDRALYSVSLSDSWKEQTLLNIIKVRYADPPVFVDIGNIVSSYTLAQNASVGVRGVYVIVGLWGSAPQSLETMRLVSFQGF